MLEKNNKKYDKSEKIFCTCCGNEMIEVEVEKDIELNCKIHTFECPLHKSFAEEKRIETNAK